MRIPIGVESRVAADDRLGSVHAGVHAHVIRRGWTAAKSSRGHHEQCRLGTHSEWRLEDTRLARWIPRDWVLECRRRERLCSLVARGILLDAVDAARTDHADRISQWYEDTRIVGIERTPELDHLVEEFLDVASAGLRGVPDPESVARRWTTFVVRHASLGADRVLPRLAELHSVFVERTRQ